jgi:hypothetical protein
MCLARLLSDGFECLVWGTLFMAMVEGRLLEVVLAEIGMWMGVLVMSVVKDTKGHMVVVVVASELCD